MYQKSGNRPLSIEFGHNVELYSIPHFLEYRCFNIGAKEGSSWQAEEDRWGHLPPSVPQPAFGPFDNAPLYLGYCLVCTEGCVFSVCALGLLFC